MKYRGINIKEENYGVWHTAIFDNGLCKSSRSTRNKKVTQALIKIDIDSFLSEEEIYKKYPEERQ